MCQFTGGEVGCRRAAAENGLSSESTLAGEPLPGAPVRSQRQMLRPGSGKRSVHNENSWGQSQAHTPSTSTDTFFPALR